jgi:Fe-S-cluster-containing hydrogenase component 2
VEVCPEGALYLVDHKATVDTSLCRECEACIAACPTEAISLTSQPAMPVPRPEPEVIQVRAEPAPLPVRARVLPVVGAAIVWAGREIVPRLADFFLDTLDRQAVEKRQIPAVQQGTGNGSQGRGGGGRRRRRRRGRRSAD